MKEQGAEKTGAHAKIVVDDEAPKKMGKAKKVVLILCAIFLGILLAVYGAGVAFFSSHFYPNSSFDDEDISYCSGDDFVSKVEAMVPGYMLTISGEDFLQQIRSDQIGLSVDPDQLRADAFALQNAWLWPVEMFSTHEASSVVKALFDESKVDALLTPAVEEYNKTAQPCEDASIAYDESLDEIVVQEEVYGNQIDLAVFLETVYACLSNMDITYQIGDSVFVQPVILSTDERFLQAIPAANTLISGEIELTMAEGAVSAGKVGKDLFVTWLTLDSETLMPTLDQALVTQWADQKGAELNTVGTQRTFTRGDGQTVVVEGGVYGWKVDTADLATTITDHVTNGNFEAIDIPCTQTADVYNGAGERDWGAYIDIDISEQKVRYYSEDDELLYETDCVTGDVTKDRATPTGLYYLRAKKSPEVLIGYNPDGSKSYESHVTYWLPFIRNSIGLHDADWRGRFGGTIYRGNGSHGCVNLPTEAAKWFYENLETNIAVLVHE